MKPRLNGYVYWLLLIALPVAAQKPVIKSVDRSSAGVNETVSITGDQFGSDASALAVWFGATQGTIKSVSNQLIEASVPAGSTYDNISVTNLTSGLTAYSREQFLMSYGGANPFDASGLAGQFDFDTESGLYDLCLCDFDKDNKTDVATANNKANAVRILRNTSTGPGNISFAAVSPSLSLTTRSLRVKCGDLNGDGKADLVISEDGDGHRVFIFQNNSSGPGNFSFTGQSLNIGRKTTSLDLADLDLDGKPEIIISNQGASSITVLQNTSTTAAVTFNTTPIIIPVSGAATTDGVAVEDLDGDGRPEIVTGQYQTSSSNVFIIGNNSVPGTITMGPVITLPLPASVKNIRIGDLDGDGKPEIACTLLLSSGISIFRNTGTTGNIAFASPVNVVTIAIPVGLDFGDLDGDGKTDISVVSIGNKTLSILNNNSTPGTLAFSRSDVATTFINRHVNIGDLDGDSKPDIAFTSIDDDNNSILASKVSILRNTHCPVPEISPAGTVEICSSATPFRISTRVSRGTTYTWRNETTNTVVATGPNPYLDVTTTGEYTVTAIAEGGTCSTTAAPLKVNVSPGTLSGVPVAGNNGPLCPGASLQLSVNNVGATEYKWSGPNGYNGTGLTPPPIPNFQIANAGRYDVDIIIGSCVARRVSTVVEAIDATGFSVTYPGSRFLCQGDNKTLTVVPNPAGTTYQWFEKTSGAISGAVNPTLTVNASGEYFVRATYPGCTAFDTDAVDIVVASLPVADFDLPSTACTGQLISFTNQSSTDAGATPVYQWTFGDGNTSTAEDPQHAYTTAATFNVKLRVAYEGGVCPQETTKPVVVQAAPIPVITNPTNTYEFCEGDSILLEINGSYLSYQWSTGETTSSIYATSGGTITAEVKTAGCTLNASRVVTVQPATPINVTASPPSINEGETAQLNAQGLLNYQWSPTETLSDDAIANPVASPSVTTTYEVIGADANGCTGKGSVQVIVLGEPIVSKLLPENFFSPNDDMVNAFWEIDNIEDYPQCSVAIYDNKGVKVYEAKPYLNDWDGTFRGSRLPDGVYFFIIRCDGEEGNPKAGSITLLR